jgi:hypothetical protein
MQMNRKRLSINAWFALALMLGSLWVGGLATTSAGDPSDYLANAPSRGCSRPPCPILSSRCDRPLSAPARSDDWCGRRWPSWLLHVRPGIGGGLRDRDPA